MKRLRRTIGNDFLNFKRKIGRMFINNTILYIHIYPRLRVRPARRGPTKTTRSGFPPRLVIVVSYVFIRVLFFPYIPHTFGHKSEQVAARVQTCERMQTQTQI